MLGFSRWQIFKTSAAAALAVGTFSLLLIYFIPAPPSTVTMATGFQGSSFEYVGQRYRDIFARSHVELKLRETTGGLDNIELLKNPNSGVQIGLVFGGVSDGERAPGVLSLGTVYTNPFWIFYSSDEPLDRLSQLKGKRIAVGPVGSAIRFSAERLLGRSGVDSTTATLLPFGGGATLAALNESKVDVVWIAGCTDYQLIAAESQGSTHELPHGGRFHPRFPGSCSARTTTRCDRSSQHHSAQ